MLLLHLHHKKTQISKVRVITANRSDQHLQKSTTAWKLLLWTIQCKLNISWYAMGAPQDVPDAIKYSELRGKTMRNTFANWITSQGMKGRTHKQASITLVWGHFFPWNVQMKNVRNNKCDAFLYIQQYVLKASTEYSRVDPFLVQSIDFCHHSCLACFYLIQ